MRKNKFIDVFGKDFSSKGAAYKHYQSLREEFVEKKLIGYERGFFTEDTPIKKSEMFKLLYTHGDPNYWEKFQKITKPYEEHIKNFWFSTVEDRKGYACWIERFIKHDAKTCENCIKISQIKGCPILCEDLLEEERHNKYAFQLKRGFTCFPGGPDSNIKVKLTIAFRDTIQQTQIKDYRKDSNCEKCGADAYGLAGEVDHKTKSFSQLTRDFMDENNYTEEDIYKFVKKRYDHDNFYYFDNKSLSYDWAEFHKKNAELQLLCKNCHANKTQKENRERMIK